MNKEQDREDDVPDVDPLDDDAETVESDLFDTDDYHVQEKIKERSQMVFDIEIASEKDKEHAGKLFSSMFTRHIALLFAFSGAGTGLYALLFFYIQGQGYKYWLGGGAALSFSVGALVTSAGTLVLLFFFEKYMLNKDQWTLYRLGIVGMDFKNLKKSLVIGLLPLAIIAVPFLPPITHLASFSGFLSLTTWLAVLGLIPVAMLEEVIFRGIYWRYITMQYSKGDSLKLAHVLNGVVFVLNHVPMLFFVLMTQAFRGAIGAEFFFMVTLYFIAGVLLSIMRAYFKQLITGVVFHVVHNIVIGFMVLAQAQSWWLLVFYGAFLLVMIIVNETDAFKMRVKAETVENEKEGREVKENQFTKPVIVTRMREWFRLVYVIGMLLIFLSHGLGISLMGDLGNILVLESLVLTIIVLGSIGGGFALLLVLMVKKISVFG